MRILVRKLCPSLLWEIALRLVAGSQAPFVCKALCSQHVLIPYFAWCWPKCALPEIICFENIY